MNSLSSPELIIAISYYDGEEEGFSSETESFSYFQRVDENDIENVYLSTKIDKREFLNLASLLSDELPKSGVFVYPGGDKEVDKLVDHLVKKYRMTLENKGIRSSGATFFQSIRRLEASEG